MRHIETYQSLNEGVLARIEDALARTLLKKTWRAWMIDWNRRLRKADLNDPGTVTALFREFIQNTTMSVLDSETSRVSPPANRGDLSRFGKYLHIVAIIQERGSFDSARALIEEASNSQMKEEECRRFLSFVRRTDRPSQSWPKTPGIPVVSDTTGWPPNLNFGRYFVCKGPTDVGTVMLKIQVSAAASVFFHTGPKSSHAALDSRRKAWNKFILDLAAEKGIVVDNPNEWVQDLCGNKKISVQEKLTGLVYAFKMAYPAAGDVPLEFLSDESIGKMDLVALAKVLSSLEDPTWLFEMIKEYIKTHSEVPSKLMAAARRAFTTEYDREFGDDDFSAEMGELGI